MSKTTNSEFVLTSEVDLPQAWKATVAECTKIAEWDLSSRRFQAMDGTEMIKAVIEEIQPAKATPGKSDKAKRVFQNVLSCIQVFGGFIAQSASLVFGPSQEIFNAVSFVINATQKYGEVFDQISILMQRLTFFLDTLTVYLEKTTAEKIDKNLRPAVYHVLMEFVKILALSYRLTHGKWHRFKLGLEVVALGKDGNISASLVTLEGLISDVTRVQVTEIHSKMDEASRNIGNIDETLVRMVDSIEKSTAQVQQVGIVLGQMKDVADVETDKKWLSKKLEIDERDVCFRISEDFDDQVPLTGRWLFGDTPKFQSWMNCRDKRPKPWNVLGLRGSEGLGKTRLCHAIVGHLQNEFKNLGSTKVYVAWYYIGRDPRKPPIHRALCHMIWQLATQDRAFLSFVKRAAKDYGRTDIQNIAKVWKDLIVDYSKTKPRSVFFFILDGLDQTDSGADGSLRPILEEAMSAFDDLDALRLRILISGRQSAFENLREADDQSLKTINLDGNSRDFTDRLADLRAFTEKRLDGMAKFKKGTLSERKAKLRSQIIEDLPGLIKGNYLDLRLKLKEIEEAESFEDIDKVLERGVLEGGVRVQREVEALNKRLNSREIERLNEILAWVYVCIDPSAEMLTSVLSAKPGNEFFDLVDHVKKTVPVLIEVDERGGEDDDDPAVTFLRFSSEDVAEYLQKASPERETLKSEEINIVQDVLEAHFKRTFGNLRLYQRFDFSAFFNAKRDVHTNLIHLNSDAAKLQVLDNYLDAICELHNSDQHKSLRAEAISTFGFRLTQADITKAEPALKQRIGSRLIRILREGEIIDAWATEDQAASQITGWMDDATNGFCTKAKGWLTDPDVRGSLSSTTAEKDWLAALSLSETHRVKVLTHVVLRVLQSWFDSNTDMDFSTFMWLRGYCRALTSPSQSLNALWETPSTAEIAKFESWALHEIDAQSGSMQCYLQMASFYINIGRWFGHKSFWATAITKCNAALTIDSTSWRAQILKGRAFMLNEDYKGCIEVFEGVIFYDPARSQKQQKEFEVEYWNQIVSNAGDACMKLERLDDAANWYRKLVDKSLASAEMPDAFPYSVNDLMQALLGRERHSECLELLSELRDRKQGDTNWLSIILGRLTIHGPIITLAHQSAHFDLVNSYYEEAGQIAPGSKDSWTRLSTVKYNQWRLHWYCGSTERKNQSLTDSDVILTTIFNNEYSPLSYPALKELGHAFFHKALECLHSPEELKVHLDRLTMLNAKGTAIFSDWLSSDVRLLIARLYHLAGNTAKAKSLLRAEVRKAMQRIDAEDDSNGGYFSLALILPIVDDDVNAIAAWSLLQPARPGHIVDVSAAVQEDAGKTGGELIPADALGREVQAVGGVAEADPDNTANNKDKSEPDLPIELTDQDTGGPQQKADIDVDSTLGGSADSPVELNGNLGLACDGDCGRFWTYADDMWICKDCLCAQLDPRCYAKLQNGTLDITVCNKEHHHLYIPAFNVTEWRTMEPGMMKVDGKLVSRKMWLEEIKRDWDLVRLERAKRAAAIVTRWAQRKHAGESQV